MSQLSRKKSEKDLTNSKFKSVKRFLCSDYYFDQMNPVVRKNFNFEQTKEIKSVLKRAIRVPSKKVLNIEVTFWFFKRFYLVFYLGLDKREPVNIAISGTLSWSIKCLLHSIITVLIWGSTLFIMFSVFYYAKSTLGIDLFPDQHLEEIILKPLKE